LKRILRRYLTDADIVEVLFREKRKNVSRDRIFPHHRGRKRQNVDENRFRPEVGESNDSQ